MISGITKKLQKLWEISIVSQIRCKFTPSLSQTVAQKSHSAKKSQNFLKILSNYFLSILLKIEGCSQQQKEPPKDFL